MADFSGVTGSATTVPDFSRVTGSAVTIPNFSNVVGSATMSPSSPAAIQSQSQERLSPSQPSLSFPPEAIKYGTMFRFVAYKYDLQQTNAKLIDTVSGAQIFLPLPAQIDMQQGIEYAGIDAGVLGFIIKQSKTVVEDVLNGKLTAGDVLDTAKSVAKGVGASADYVLRRFADKTLSGAGAQIDQNLGTVVNPYNVATFRNSQSRSHQLQFMLIPRSSAESQSIRHICETFVWHSLPSAGTGVVESQSTPGQSMFLNMPDEVEISFYGSTSLYKFARAVITNVSINYAPFGEPSFFPDGAPTAVQLSLSIQEIQQLTQSSYSPNDASSFSDSTAAQSDSNGVVSDVAAILGGGS